MKEIIEKLSSYNLFNYLLPGIIFVVFASNFTQFNLIQENIFEAFFVYYFIGLVISRFGSLIIEPILKKIGFLKFADYKLFLKASKVDSKIEVLSEANNMYRTFCSTFILLLLVKGYEVFEASWAVLAEIRIIVLATIFFLMFLFGYRKQTKFITSRIEANKE